MYIFALLTACGGGGGATGVGGSISGDGTPYALTQPLKLTSTPPLGTPSYPAIIRDYGAGIMSFTQYTDTGNWLYGSGVHNASSSSPFQLFPAPHITTEVTSSWAGGWTGKGVNISVIDDFNNNSLNITRNTSTSRSITFEKVSNPEYGKLQGFYDVTYSYGFPISHGRLVSTVVGGNFDGAQDIVLGLSATFNRQSLNSCLTLRAAVGSYSIICDLTFNFHQKVKSTGFQPVSFS